MERNLSLAPATWAALERIAEQEDLSVGQVIRDAIHRDLNRRQAKAKTTVRADERLVAPLRALLADDFAHARNWDNLIQRLGVKGYFLAESGGGLILMDRRTGHRLCKASELGYSLSRLTARFDASFPGHAHQSVLRRVRENRMAQAAPQDQG